MHVQLWMDVESAVPCRSAVLMLLLVDQHDWDKRAYPYRVFGMLNAVALGPVGAAQNQSEYQADAQQSG